ncbi:hypothetical protein, partial [Rhodospirillum sp. A1_3_36]|uniref:hypothetical protein n=1 Tax=Rhodospirillum sp. A1_3_36 TaxID=3391666 RepID=UPI0039A49F54
MSGTRSCRRSGERTLIAGQRRAAQGEGCHRDKARLKAALLEGAISLSARLFFRRLPLGQEGASPQRPVFPQPVG